MFKKIFLAAIFLALLFRLFSTETFAQSTSQIENRAEFIDCVQLDELGVPIVKDTNTLNIADWDGKKSFKANTCYFIEKTMTLSKSISLPESSMLIIRQGAVVKVRKDVRLLINGTLSVHTGAKINIQNGGSLIMKSSSIGVLNGTLAISKGGYIGVYGYMQCRGTINVKGRFSIQKNGTLTINRKMNVYSGSVVKGNTVINDTAYPLYMMQELEDVEKCDISIEHFNIITDSNDKKSLVKSFEGVLYKDGGAINIPDSAEDIGDYTMDIFACEWEASASTKTNDIRLENSNWLSSGEYRFGIYDWNGTPIIEKTDFNNELLGRFYTIVKGKPDIQLCMSLTDINVG